MATILTPKIPKWTAGLLFLFLVSCGGDHFFDEFQSTKGGWKKEDIKKFTFEQKDTVGNYDVYINIRNNNNYPYSNLFLIVKTFMPNGKATVDTMQYEMARPDGSLLGEGFSDTKTSKLLFKNAYTFKTPGVYTVEIEHAIRSAGKTDGVTVLDGVTDVGLRIEKR